MDVFDYSDIVLLPRKCRVQSRSECDPGVQLGKRRFRLPVIPANMRTVVNEAVCVWLAQHGYFYIMHRFTIDTLAFVRKMQSWYGSISIGVKPADYDLVQRLAAAGLMPEYTTIDIAHGHADSVQRMIGHVRRHLPDTWVIAGNVATPEAVIDLEAWGADAVKVGVGPGKVCTTQIKTGFGTRGWQLSAVQACAQAATKPIIADGGVRSHGDIAKAIRFGATMVMVGALLAGHEESPGKLVDIDGQPFKEYYGSASDANQGNHRHVEGELILEPLKGRLADTLVEMEQALQSAISYAGGSKLQDLTKAGYVRLSSGQKKGP